MAATFHGFVVNNTPGTAVPLVSGTTPVAANWVTIFPREVNGAVNAGEVRIGGIGADIPPGSGLPLNPGDAGVVWPMSQTYYDLREIGMDADSSGDGVQFAYGVV